MTGCFSTPLAYSPDAGIVYGANSKGPPVVGPFDPIKEVVMKVHRIVVFVTVGVLAFWLPGLNSAAEAFSQSATLRGLKAIVVGVSELPQELKDIGLTEESLYEEVVSILKKTGIKVNVNRYAIAGEPDFLVDIFGGEFIQGVITYCIDVRLDQAVILERNRRIRSNATTWSQKFIGVAGFATKPKVIRKHLRELVEIFAKEYSAENPK